MNKDFVASVITVSGLIGAGAGLTESGLVFVARGTQQQQQPDQPQPSQPQPTQPAQPGQQQPAQPTKPNQPAQTRPADRLPSDRRDDRRERAPGETRPQRPFTFQSPQAEARFIESSKRLVQMEQRMQRSNQELLRRLGEARSLSGDRQSNAVMELLQQFLADQADVQRYLIQARAAWSGDELDTNPDQMTPRNAPDDGADQTPDLAPRTSPAAPRTPK